MTEFEAEQKLQGLTDLLSELELEVECETYHGRPKRRKSSEVRADIKAEIAMLLGMIVILSE